MTMTPREYQYERLSRGDIRDYLAAGGKTPRYLQMLDRHGFKGTAMALCKPSLPCQSGFYDAWLFGWPLERTVEGRVVEFPELFPEECVNEAQKRLAEVRNTPPPSKELVNLMRRKIT